MQRTWILISLTLSLLVSYPTTAQERITSFHSEIIVNKDASLTVTETIDVVANGDQIKHGIYRDFPTKYADGVGRVVRVGFKVINTGREGGRGFAARKLGQHRP